MSRYLAAGVDIDAANSLVGRFAPLVTATKTPAVRSDIGAFGGLFAADEIGEGKVLVASTDGVGSKATLAASHGRYKGLGFDLLNHCVNDILVQGAAPLFFLDYIAAASLQADAVVSIVEGLCEAAQAVQCAVLGGETAEMPGVYHPGALDIVGTIVGVVNNHDLLPQTKRLVEGDLLVGLASDGPHTNGYSLIRALLEDRTVTAVMLDYLLTPHRCYLHDIADLAHAGLQPKALAHITGGGVIDNLPRVLPHGLKAQIDLSSWHVPSEFRRLVDWSQIDDDEAFRVWNMGIGMIVIVGKEQAKLITELNLPVVGSLLDCVHPTHDPSVSFAGHWR